MIVFIFITGFKFILIDGVGNVAIFMFKNLFVDDNGSVGETVIAVWKSIDSVRGVGSKGEGVVSVKELLESVREGPYSTTHKNTNNTL